MQLMIKVTYLATLSYNPGTTHGKRVNLQG